MKKLVLFVAAAATLGLASCKKDWTCECTYTDSNNQQQKTSTTITGKTKKDAEAECEGKASFGGITISTGSNCNTIKK